MMSLTGAVIDNGFEWVTPRYMEDFSCIGSACEKNCCHGWQIAVDKPTYKRLKHSMSHSRGDREEFKRGLERNRDDKFGNGVFARIAGVVDGDCPFLDGDSLCSIHARFGPSHLGQVCRTYPKAWSQYGRRIELFGDLSCPEVARRLLLAEDALELTTLGQPPSDPSSLLLTHRLGHGELNPYCRYLDEIRQVGMHLLAVDYPLDSRLFFLACFADSIAPFFHRDSEVFAEEQLAAAIGAMTAPAELHGIHREFQAIDSRTDFSLELVAKILLARIKGGNSDFVALLEKVLTNAVGEDGARDDGNKLTLREFYEARKAAGAQVLAGRMNRYFENYCRNYWLSEWYVESLNPAEHVRKLLVRLAVLRVLLLCHPGLNDILGKTEVGAEDEARLEQVVVEVFSIFSRGVEHNRQFLQQIHEFLTDSGHDELVIQAMLLKV